jgi:hypothetical protein
MHISAISKGHDLPSSGNDMSAVPKPGPEDVEIVDKNAIADVSAVEAPDSVRSDLSESDVFVAQSQTAVNAQEKPMHMGDPQKKGEGETEEAVEREICMMSPSIASNCPPSSIVADVPVMESPAVNKGMYMYGSLHKNIFIYSYVYIFMIIFVRKCSGNREQRGGG